MSESRKIDVSAADLDNSATDYVAATVKAILGMAPIAGPLLAELAGTIIPKQRADRLASFVSMLDEKLRSMDKDMVRTKLLDENFTDLLEETARHATRSLTEERREYLASLLASGMSKEHVSFVESKHLLRILGEINDVEVIWLRFYLNPHLEGDEEFRATHAQVLEPVAAHIGSDQETVDREALQDNYVQHLVSLGLLSRPLRADAKTGQPTFDRSSGNWRMARARVTPLGRLLLRQIGLYEETN